MLKSPKLKIITFIAIALLLLLIIFFPGFSKIQELRQENRELDGRISDIEEENISLGQEGLRLKTDEFYIEKTARKNLGIIKKGETIYKIIPEE